MSLPLKTSKVFKTFEVFFSPEPDLKGFRNL